MRREGKLDLVGVSNVTLEGARAAVELEDSLAEIQNAYSVLDRHNEPVLDLCREREIAFVPFFPLGSAFAGGPRTLGCRPRRRRGRRQARRHPLPGGAGVATGAR